MCHTRSFSHNNLYEDGKLRIERAKKVEEHREIVKEKQRVASPDRQRQDRNIKNKLEKELHAAWAEATEGHDQRLFIDYPTLLTVLSIMGYIESPSGLKPRQNVLVFNLWKALQLKSLDDLSHSIPEHSSDDLTDASIGFDSLLTALASFDGIPTDYVNSSPQKASHQLKVTKD